MLHSRAGKKVTGAGHLCGQTSCQTRGHSNGLVEASLGAATDVADRLPAGALDGAFPAFGYRMGVAAAVNRDRLRHSRAKGTSLMTRHVQLVTGVDFVVVPTDAFEAAVAFYGEVLGLPASSATARCPAPSSNLTLAVMENKALGREFRPNTKCSIRGRFRRRM
jgi:hypothetical protein